MLAYKKTYIICDCLFFY